MKNKKIKLVALMILLVVLLTGVLFIVMASMMNKEEKASNEELNLETYGAWIECELLQDLPVMKGKDVIIGDVVDYGRKHYVLDVNGTTVEEYKSYITLLQSAGYKKHSDNGEDGLEGYVYATSLVKDNLTLTVSHIVKEDKTYIAGAQDLPLSEHLIYQDSYIAGNQANAKTRVHMLELNDNGNSFIIQLKNGRFVVHDGGGAADAPYLVEYLESLTPGDEKPVIEAWFISHAHNDHYGAVWEIGSNEKYQNRLVVNGFYFTEPNLQGVSLELSASQSVGVCRMVNKAFKSENGEVPELYRPQIGQRYYFNDIYIDVPLTAEQLPYDSYDSSDLNDTSIWLMHHIEGQKFLLSGDTNNVGMRKAMKLYDESYFDMEVMAVFHHGINVYDYFTNYCDVKTLLYTSFRAGSVWSDGSWKEAKEANETLRQSVEEYYHRGDGTVVLDFPYKVGTAKVLPTCGWKYNTIPGKPQRSNWGS